ncbi:damage-control phosphatase [Thermococcus atlanticus]
MKVHYECLSCIVTQSQRVAELSTEDAGKRREAMIKAAKFLGEHFNHDAIPAILGSEVFLMLYDYLENDDPFKAYKVRSNLLAKSLVEDLRKKLTIDLKCALKLSIAGNVIDFAVGYDPEKIEEDIMKMLDEELYIDESGELFERLKNAKTLLYLTDNCGEIYFDRLFIERIKEEFPELRIYIAAKEGPIINDATVEDLLAAGFGDVGIVISTGSRIVGVPSGGLSSEFMEAFKEADLIIAKGQGNFETLSEFKDGRVFYLLKAKCPPLARELGVPRGAMLCLRR